MKHSIALLAAILPSAYAQEPEPAQFAPPIQLLRDGANHTGILYPSPVLYDLDGNGQRELVIGDLKGHITFSQRVADGEDHQWTAAEQLQSQGKPLKLDNW